MRGSARRAKGRPASVQIVVDGTARPAWDGQSVAAVLVASGIWALRRNLVTGDLRGPFCGMGVCLECEVKVDGRDGVRSCTQQVEPGMDIRTLTDLAPAWDGGGEELGTHA